MKGVVIIDMHHLYLDPPPSCQLLLLATNTENLITCHSFTTYLCNIMSNFTRPADKNRAGNK